MTGSIVAALAAIAFGALVLWWAAACRQGTFRRNPVLGYRTPLTLRNDDAWASAHRAAAPLIATAGGGVLAAGAAALVLAAIGLGEAVPIPITGAVLWALVWLVAAGFPAVRASRAANAR